MCAELPQKNISVLFIRYGHAPIALLNKYYGIYGKHPGKGIVYYFLKHRVL